MAHQHVVTVTQARYADPTIRRIGTADLFEALARGVADDNREPSHLRFPILIYLLVALALAELSFGLLHRSFPPAAGLALLGPVAIIGLYELRRCRPGRGDRLEPRFRRPMSGWPSSLRCKDE